MKTKKKKSENPYTRLENAKSILKEKAIKEGEFYTYPKYVKMAGHTAWGGVLLALDYLMKKYGIMKKGRKKVEDYQDFLSQRNRKMLNYFNSAYDHLHLLMGYDGELLVKTNQTGLELASKIIDWAAKQVEFEKEEK